jgi:hypothetical protein
VKQNAKGGSIISDRSGADVRNGMCARHAIYTMRIVESMGLKVEKPMILEIDNKGAVDLTNNWSVGGRTRHIDTRYYFLRELKEQNIIKTVWLSGLEMPSDLFTKNLARPLFEKHLMMYCGTNEYLKNRSNPQDG